MKQKTQAELGAVILELHQRYKIGKGPFPWQQIMAENPELRNDLRYQSQPDGEHLRGTHAVKRLRDKGQLPPLDKRFATKRGKAGNDTNGAPLKRTYRKSKLMGWEAAKVKRAQKQELMGQAQAYLETAPDGVREVIEAKIRDEAATKAALIINKCKFCPQCGNDLQVLFAGATLNT